MHNFQAPCLPMPPVHYKGQARGIKVIKVTKKAIILHSPPPRLLGDPLACRNFDSTHGFQDLTDGLEQNSERLAPWQHSYQLGTSLLNAGHPSKPRPLFIHTTDLAARRNCNRFGRHVSQLVNEGRKIPKSRVWSSALSVRLRNARQMTRANHGTGHPRERHSPLSPRNLPLSLSDPLLPRGEEAVGMSQYIVEHVYSHPCYLMVRLSK